MGLCLYMPDKGPTIALQVGHLHYNTEKVKVQEISVGAFGIRRKWMLYNLMVQPLENLKYLTLIRIIFT